MNKIMNKKLLQKFLRYNNLQLIKSRTLRVKLEWMNKYNQNMKASKLIKSMIKLIKKIVLDSKMTTQCHRLNLNSYKALKLIM